MTIERARISLEGLSVGDAAGEQILHSPGPTRALVLDQHVLPANRTWQWTDDTAMAHSIVEELAGGAGIDPDSLARRFAEHHHRDPARGYGRGAHQVLDEIYSGTPYDAAAKSLFGGQGSQGNGGGMRSAPIGAYYCDDLARAVEHAGRSATPTHVHPEGVAGAIAIAVAAARAFAGERDPRQLLEAVVAHTPASATRDGVRRAIALLGSEPIRVAAELGNGSHVLASDTIPFAVWAAASNLHSFEAAFWACATVGGDTDTLCAMACGIVVGAVGVAGIPADWRAAREPLP